MSKKQPLQLSRIAWKTCLNTKITTKTCQKTHTSTPENRTSCGIKKITSYLTNKTGEFDSDFNKVWLFETVEELYFTGLKLLLGFTPYQKGFTVQHYQIRWKQQILSLHGIGLHVRNKPCIFRVIIRIEFLFFWTI